MRKRRPYKKKNNDVRLGIWIDIELIKDVELDWTNKALLTEILSLHNIKKCTASNNFFGNLLGVNNASASKRITQLTNLGYITTKDTYDERKCIGRVITPTIKTINSGIIHLPVEGSSPKNQVVVPEQQDSSSQTIEEAVPEIPDGSSHTNTINTTTNSKELIQATNTDVGENLIEISFKSKNQIIQEPIIKENCTRYEPQFPEEFFAILDKRENSGWNSLSVPEAALFWKYKKEYNRFIDAHPELDDYERL